LPILSQGALKNNLQEGPLNERGNTVLLSKKRRPLVSWGGEGKLDAARRVHLPFGGKKVRRFLGKKGERRGRSPVMG